MTFAQIEEWVIEDRPVKAAKPMVLLSALNDRNREWSVSRKGFAVAGSIIVHLLLLYFFVNKLTGAAPARQLGGNGGPSLSVFNLSSASNDRTETKSEKAASAPKRDEAIQKPVPVVPAEWKLSTISVPSAASATSGQSISTGTSTSTPTGGGYDPYAGASPMPLTPAVSNTFVNTESSSASSSADPITVNQDVLAKVRAIARRHSRPSDVIKLILSFGADGTLNNLKIIGVSPDTQAQIKAYVGRHKLIENSAASPGAQERTLTL